MRPSINKELRSLCNQQIPVTDQLLGNDVQNSLKTIKECNKIANNCTQAQGSEHKRYNNGYKPFLGHRKDHGYITTKRSHGTTKGRRRIQNNQFTNSYQLCKGRCKFILQYPTFPNKTSGA